MLKQEKTAPTPETEQGKKGMNRRSFIKMSLLAAPALFYGGTFLERMATQEDARKPLKVLGIRNLDIPPLMPPDILAITRVTAEYGNRTMSITFFGVMHHFENAVYDAAAIAGTSAAMGADIVCTEFPIFYASTNEMRSEGADKYRKAGYFGTVVSGANMKGIPAAIIEGWAPGSIDILSTTGINGLIAYGFMKLSSALKKTNSLGAYFIAKVASVATGIWTLMDFLTGEGVTLEPVGVNRLTENSLDERLHPVELLQRNRYFAAAIRKVVEAGYENIVVVTGAGHTDGTIARIGEDVLPSSAAFSSEITIVHPNNTVEKLQLR